MKTKLGMFLLAGLLMATSGYAQKKNFSYKFYGQVRGDLFYNSRANAENVDGLFYLYPKDVNPDADGNDLNATANGSFYVLYSRLGLDVTGPNIGKAKTSLKLEADFRGSEAILPCYAYAMPMSTWIGVNRLFCWGRRGIRYSEMCLLKY